jgi:hypothetical protein
MRKIVSRLFTASVGAGVMYFMDPDRGRARRARTKDQLAGFVRHKLRRATRTVEREVHYAGGRAEGLLAKAAGGGHYRPESQADLREHLKQVIAELQFPTSNVNVDVANGVATLRGQVETRAQAEAVVAKVGAVLGVERVENLLHLPGERAPNKAAAIEASEEGGAEARGQAEAAGDVPGEPEGAAEAAGDVPGEPEGAAEAGEEAPIST